LRGRQGLAGCGVRNPTIVLAIGVGFRIENVKSFIIFIFGLALGLAWGQRDDQESVAQSNETRVARARPRRSVRGRGPAAMAEVAGPQLEEVLESKPPPVSSNELERKSLECRQQLLAQDVEESIKCSLDCLSDDPNQADCRATLIWAYNQRGEVERAVPYITDCLKDNPEESVCLSPNDFLRVRDGDEDEALDFVSKVTEVNPEASWSQYLSALMEQRLGHFSKAQSLFRQACDKGRVTACGFVAQNTIPRDDAESFE
jgi:tetratricopeptide (TPR) repeat protein